MENIIANICPLSVRCFCLPNFLSTIVHIFCRNYTKQEKEDGELTNQGDDYDFSYLRYVYHFDVINSVYRNLKIIS